MMMKKISSNSIILLLVVSLFIVYACNGTDTIDTTTDDTTSSETTDDSDTSSVTSDDYTDAYTDTTDEENDIENGDIHENDDDYTFDENAIVEITLNGSSISSSSSNVSIDGTIGTITAGGTYRITGTLTDGQIIVDSDDDETVKILLNGVDITNTSQSPFAIMSAEKTVVIVLEDTDNYLTDTENYTFEEGEDEPDAALFSKDDLSIYGSGKLNVSGNYNEAIKSKDGLILKDVNIAVTSADDGIQGKDYLVIRSGTLNIDVEGDGLKSNNDEDAALGYIQIDDGDITIVSGADAIQAETDLLVNGGDFILTSGGGSNASLGSDDSAKGLKGGASVVVDTGSTISINAADDGIHSNDNVVINGGVIEIASGDDGIHSDSDLTINDGSVVITKSYEGIEAATITMEGGSVELVASDDGVNGAGDASGSNYYFYMNGGYIYINASGDGIDVNGSIVMTDGVIIVNGPTSNGNGALDFDKSFTISGGYLLAVGSEGMAQAPSSSSSQNSVLVKFGQTFSANTLIHLEKSDGTNLFTFAPAKNYQSVVFSSPGLVNGSNYKIYTGGSCDGNSTNGLYTDGTYTVGNLFDTFSISSTVTTVR